MRKIREILRLRLSAKLSIRQISDSTKVSVGKVQNLLTKAETLGLGWPLPDDLDDPQLAMRFYPAADTGTSRRFEPPDWTAVHQELKRKGMTLQLLWEEYCQRFPNRCYSYSQYTERYRQWKQKQKRSMRQTHRAGEKCFVDYCGPRVPVVDPGSGEIREAAIFVGVLGASNYTFAEATWTQSLRDWLGSHTRMFDFFGGCPELVIPDNLKSGVSKACRYDPEVNPSYQQLAAHYQVAVLPARPYKPKDKAKAEVGVQIVERWILARLRKLTFFSLGELNQAIRALLVELNEKPFKQLPGNRRQAFEQLDRPALRPLPRQSYQYTEIKTVKVNIDYHVQFKDHCYSVPHQYVGERLELHASDQLISLYFQHRQIACHVRKHRPGYTTESGHMPERHRKHQQWTPQRLLGWARDIGPETQAWVRRELEARDHPEQAYRPCLGLLNLSRQYPAVRLESACRLANREGLRQSKQVKSILASNRDQLPEQIHLSIPLPQDHENIRGPKDFN
jgi:transposase